MPVPAPLHAPLPRVRSGNGRLAGVDRHLGTTPSSLPAAPLLRALRRGAASRRSPLRAVAAAPARGAGRPSTTAAEAVASPARPAAPPADPAPADSATSAASAPPEVLSALASKVASMGGPKLAPDDPSLRTTPAQAATVALWVALEALLVGGSLAAAAAAGPASLAACALSAVVAYLAADLASGLFHFATDNYGDRDTPVFGKVIDAFQGHHRYPRTITRRGFANNVAPLCAPQLPFLLALLLLAPAPAAPAARLGAALFLGLAAMSQQTHAWAHATRPELPPAVRALQDAGLCVSAAAHAAHHRPPYSGHYAIVSGLTSGWLDSGVTAALERAVFAATGVAPRSWLPEPQSAWATQPDAYDP